VTNDQSPPPFRELSSERLRVREQHLLHETRLQPHRLPHRRRSLVAAAVVVAAVVATPALGFSTTVRELVGLKGSSSPPTLYATLTGRITHKPAPRPGSLVMVTFTAGELHRPPGTGVPRGSVFYVSLLTKPGVQGWWQPIAADGKNGRYSATSRVPPGGVRGIAIGVGQTFRGIRPPFPTFGVPITNPYGSPYGTT